MKCSTFKSAVLCLVLSLPIGCTVNLVELKYSPRARTPHPSPTVGGEGMLPVAALLERSRKETTAGTKALVTNAIISDGFRAAKGLGSDSCVQAVELNSGEILVDFGDAGCPDMKGLLPAENLVFTLYYEESTQSFYDLVLEMVPLGSVGINVYERSAVLNDLCTGSYEAHCTLSVVDGKFARLEP